MVSTTFFYIFKNTRVYLILTKLWLISYFFIIIVLIYLQLNVVGCQVLTIYIYTVNALFLLTFWHPISKKKVFTGEMSSNCPTSFSEKCKRCYSEWLFLFLFLFLVTWWKISSFSLIRFIFFSIFILLRSSFSFFSFSNLISFSISWSNSLRCLNS